MSEQTENVFVLNNISWSGAKKAELEKLKKKNVYKEVVVEIQTSVSTRWVCTLKETPEIITTKARLVARGFEEKGVEDVQKDSPIFELSSTDVLSKGMDT